LFGGARLYRFFKQVEGKARNTQLSSRIVRQTRAIAEREVIEQHARNTDALDYVAGATHDHRGNPGFFERPRGKAHGLVAHGAIGNQDCSVHGVFAAAGNQLRTVDFNRGFLRAITWQTVVPGRYPFDLAGPC